MKQAEICASADDGMKLAINGHLRLTTEARNESWRQARKTSIAAEIKPGRNELRVLVENAKPRLRGFDRPARHHTRRRPGHPADHRRLMEVHRHNSATTG